MDEKAGGMLDAFDEWKEERALKEKMLDQTDNKAEVASDNEIVNTYDLYNKVYNDNIVLMYKGAITFDLITSIIETLDRKIGLVESDKKVQKLFYSAAVEVVHNLYHHMDEMKGAFEGFTEQDAKSGMITVLAKPDYYNILTGNFIPTENTYTLKEKIDEVNTTDKSGLRTLYKETLSNGQFSDKGTAGLGLIQLARKTGEQLNYKFDKVNSQYSYFTFQIKINRN